MVISLNFSNLLFDELVSHCVPKVHAQCVGDPEAHPAKRGDTVAPAARLTPSYSAKNRDLNLASSPTRFSLFTRSLEAK